MRVEHHYDVTPRALFDVLVDPTFLDARGARFGANGPARVERADGSTVVRTPRAFPMEHVPGPLRGFAGNGHLVQVDTWSDVTEDRVLGSWQVEVGSAPIDLTGHHEIGSRGGGCVYVVTARAKVRIPLVGRAAEKSISEHLATLVHKELEFTADWLTGSS